MDLDTTLTQTIYDTFETFRHGVSSKDNELKTKLSKTIIDLRNINSRNFFSEDEDLSELSESSLSTILIPYLVAEFLYNFATPRKAAISSAQKEYQEYLKTLLLFKPSLNEHLVSFIEFSEQDSESTQYLLSKRNNMIQRSRYSREAIAKADAIRELSTEKIMYILEYATIQTLSALSSIDTEIEILNNMPETPIEEPVTSTDVIKPIEVVSFNTREEFQKRVHDLPAWCTSGANSGVPKDVFALLSDSNTSFVEAPKYQWKPETLERGNIYSKNSVNKERKEIERENLSTAELEVELERLRQELMERDDWLDTHKRGEGNRRNKG